MADKSFGVKQINLIGASGTPTIESPNNLNLNATNVAISTDVTIGGQVSSNLIVREGFYVGVGTTNPTKSLEVMGDVKIGMNNSQGIILTSPNGTEYRLIVDDSGVLSTVLVT